MRFTSVANRHQGVIRHVVLAGLAGLSLVSLPIAADPFQPARALVAALAIGVAFVIMRDGPAVSRTGHVAAALLGAALLLTMVSALVAHSGSTVFGVHGRHQALLALGLAMLAGTAGFLALHSGVRILARWTALASSVQALVVLIQVSRGMVPTGLVGNQVLVGAVLCLGTAVAFAAGRVESGPVRLALLAAGVLGATALGAVGSRGAWIGLATGLLVLVIADRFRGKTLYPIVAVVALTMIIALVVGGEPAQKLKVSSLTEGSAAARWQIWVGTSAMIADQPVLGVGPGRFLYEYPRYQTLAHALTEGPDVRTDVAHSHGLQMAAESGVPAAIALAGLAGLALVAGVRAARSGDALALVAVVGFAAYVGQGVFGIGTVETDVMGWLLGGAALARGARRSDAVRADDAATLQVAAVTAAAGTLLSFGVAIAVGFYLWADVAHARGLAAFAQADFAGAYAAHAQAIERDPLVDVYRVAQADAALYGAGSPATVLTSLSDGLRIEPASFDLALARARVLHATDGGPDEIAAAYVAAADLYPLGIEVRREAIPVLLDAGYDAEARTMAQAVLRQVPGDPVARAVVGDDE